MSQTDPGTLMERLRDGFQRLIENRMNLILICAVTGIILIAASYIWDEQAEPAESVSDAGTLLSADTRTLEQRLSEMVSRIDGAGRSCVMVTMDSTREAVYAQDLRETEDTSSSSESGRTTESGNISREQTHILMDKGSGEEPLVEKQIEPQVRGVMILCEGAENPVVELCLAFRHHESALRKFQTEEEYLYENQKAHIAQGKDEYGGW